MDLERVLNGYLILLMFSMAAVNIEVDTLIVRCEFYVYEYKWC